MAKRKYNTNKISYTKYISGNIKDTKPPCFNHKEEYCKEELCGEYFNECKKNIEDNTR